MTGVLRFILRKAAQLFVTLLLILTLFFALFEAMPARPVDLMATANPQITAAQKAEFVHETGYDLPMWERYFIFMKNMLTFQFGRSWSTTQPVTADLFPSVARTLIVFGSAVVVSYAIGVLLGAIIAWHRGGALDAGVLVSSLFFYNMPSFWIGLIALYFFAFRWPIFSLTASIPTATPTLADYASHWTLLLVVLTVLNLAGTILLMRTSMLDVIGEGYVKTAIAKGLTRRAVMFRHAARNAMLPVLTGFILSIVFAVSGAVILESVMSFPGAGLYFIDALSRLDFPAAEASLYILSLLVLLGNFVSDVLYGLLDPRVRVGTGVR
ncbi:MAG: ABC transporter permease [Thermoplasmatota archaeon]